MAIPSTRYVDITSSVGGQDQVSERELVLRRFTPKYVTYGEVWEFESADDVGLEFGFSSSEYELAVKYFGFVSKQGYSPDKIQFALWSQSNTVASVTGGDASDLATIQTVTDADISATLNGVTISVSSLDLSASTDLDDVAADLQTAFRAEEGAEAWTVTYGSADNAFTVEDPTLPTEFGSTSFSCENAIAGPALGFEDDDLTLVNATIVQTPVEAVSASSELSNNFGSFIFATSTGGALTEEEITALSSWNHSQNVLYQYHFAYVGFDEDFYDSISGYSGTGYTYQGADVSETHEVLPCAILAATNFTKAAASQNYMYQQMADLTPSVTTSAVADTKDAIRANYYGQTQESGTNVSFYQRGYLMGLSTSPTQMGVFANEQWMKSYIKASYLNQLLVLPIFPADSTGLALAYATLSDAVTVAKFNGVISATKELSSTQQQYITAITGDSEAWKQVQSIGYWYDAEITSEVDNDVTEYILEYTLIYSKNDAVNKITGSHILI